MLRLAVLALVLLPTVLQAQISRKIIIANGGDFSDTTDVTTVAVWTTLNNTYFVFDTINANSVQDVLMQDQYAYVAADGQIYKYDIDSYTLLHTAAAPGVTSLAVAPNQTGIVAACGFPASSNYVRLFDQADLNEVGSVTGISGQCHSVVVVEDTAYVTVPGSFGTTTGSVALCDLNALSLVAEINLDTLGEGITDIYYQDSQNLLITLNSRSFSNPTSAFSTIAIGARTGNSFVNQFPMSFNGGTALVGNTVYGMFDNSFNNVEINPFNPNSVSNSPRIDGFWAGSAMDIAQTEFLLAATDYATYGTIYRYNSTGMLLDSIAVGVSPEAFAIDPRLGLSTSDLLSEEVYIRSYPNPFTDRVTVDASRLKYPVLSLEIYTFGGQKVLSAAATGSETELDVSQLPAGNYLLRAHTRVGDYAQHLLKR